MRDKAAPATVARMNALVNGLLRQAESDSAVADITARALAAFPHQLMALEMARLTDAELAEKGWTRDELNVAIHALAPKNQAAFAMHAAHERHIHRIRARENSGDGAPEAQGFVIPIAAPRQPHALPPRAEDED